MKSYKVERVISVRQVAVVHAETQTEAIENAMQGDFVLVSEQTTVSTPRGWRVQK